jgi:hypothetical protein
MPLPKSLAHLKREISEKKWASVRPDDGLVAGLPRRSMYKMPRKQQPDKTVAGSSERFASRFYQLKTGHCLTGQYLGWTRNQPTCQVLVVPL